MTEKAYQLGEKVSIRGVPVRGVSIRAYVLYIKVLTP